MKEQPRTSLRVQRPLNLLALALFLIGIGLSGTLSAGETRVQNSAPTQAVVADNPARVPTNTVTISPTNVNEFTRWYFERVSKEVTNLTIGLETNRFQKGAAIRMTADTKNAQGETFAANYRQGGPFFVEVLDKGGVRVPLTVEGKRWLENGLDIFRHSSQGTNPIREIRLDRIFDVSRPGEYSVKFIALPAWRGISRVEDYESYQRLPQVRGVNFSGSQIGNEVRFAVVPAGATNAAPHEPVVPK
jgi:hypothetical protein